MLAATGAAVGVVGFILPWTRLAPAIGGAARGFEIASKANSVVWTPLFSFVAVTLLLLLARCYGYSARDGFVIATVGAASVLAPLFDQVFLPAHRLWLNGFDTGLVLTLGAAGLVTVGGFVIAADSRGMPRAEVGEWPAFFVFVIPLLILGSVQSSAFWARILTSLGIRDTAPYAFLPLAAGALALAFAGGRVSIRLLGMAAIGVASVGLLLLDGNSTSMAITGLVAVGAAAAVGLPVALQGAAAVRSPQDRMLAAGAIAGGEHLFNLLTFTLFASLPSSQSNAGMIVAAAGISGAVLFYLASARVAWPRSANRAGWQTAGLLIAAFIAASVIDDAWPVLAMNLQLKHFGQQLVNVPFTAASIARVLGIAAAAGCSYWLWPRPPRHVLWAAALVTAAGTAGLFTREVLFFAGMTIMRFGIGAFVVLLLATAVTEIPQSGVWPLACGFVLVTALVQYGAHVLAPSWKDLQDYTPALFCGTAVAALGLALAVRTTRAR